MKDVFELLFREIFQFIGETLGKSVSNTLSSAGQSRIPRDQDGWITLRRTILSTCLGIFCFALAIGSMIFPYLLTAPPNQLQFQIPFALSIALALAAWFGVYALLIVRVRFNKEHVEYRGALRRLSIPWNEVNHIASNSLIGTYASTSDGILIISKASPGYAQFISAAKKHRVKIDAKLKETFSKN